MTQAENEAEVHFAFVKAYSPLWQSKESLQKMICTLYSVPLRKNTMHQLANWR